MRIVQSEGSFSPVIDIEVASNPQAKPKDDQQNSKTASDGYFAVNGDINDWKCEIKDYNFIPKMNGAKCYNV